MSESLDPVKLMEEKINWIKSAISDFDEFITRNKEKLSENTVTRDRLKEDLIKFENALERLKS